MNEDYILREIIHNHPNESGPSGRSGGDKGDIPNASLYHQNDPNTILKVYLQYTEHGIIFSPVEIQTIDVLRDDNK